MRTKVRGPDSLELALEKRKNEKWPFFQTSGSGMYIAIDLMNDLGLVR